MSITITEVTRYEVLNKLCKTKQEAIDTIETHIVDALKPQLMNKGLSLSDAYKVFEVIFANREFLKYHLDYEFDY